MKALQDKQELRARNKAYKTTLQYCPETCVDVDAAFGTAMADILLEIELTPKQIKQIEHTLYNLRETVKDVGTRKLRKTFVDYVLEKQSEEI